MRLTPVKVLLIVFIAFIFKTPVQAQLQLPQQPNQQQQQQRPQTYKIAGVTVEGNVFSDEQTIIALSGLRPGEDMTADKLQLAIKSIWQRQQFSNVDITIDRITSLGAFLLIKVEEFPRFAGLEVHGNDNLSLKDISDVVKKGRGDILNPYDIHLAKNAIKKLYEKEGILFPIITSETVATDTASYFRLIINIKEGPEYKIAGVDFIGNTNFTDDELLDSFEDTKKNPWWKFWSSSKFDNEKYEADKKRLVGFYKSKGFIDAEIVRDTVKLDEQKEEAFVEIEVQEGNRVYVRDVKFAGNTVYQSDVLERRLGFKKGEEFNQERFEKNLEGNEDQTDVKSLYLDNGYLGMQINRDIQRVASDSVDIVLAVNEGTRYTIRRVEITGNTKTKDKVIRRELYTRPGDYFDRSAIIRSVRGLGVLNYFTPEALKPDVKMVDNTSVDVVYAVEERSTDTFNASLGYAGALGLTGSVGFTFNNFSISEPLKGGSGQVFNFNWEIGQGSRIRTFSLGFTEPWLLDEPTTLGFNLYDRRQQFGYDLRQTGLFVNLGRRFRFPDDYFRGDWSVGFRRNDLKSESTSFYKTGVTTEATLSQTISRISLDNIVFPTSGSRFSFSTQFAGGALGIGSVDYLKNGLNFETITPLAQIEGQNRLVLYLSSELGYLTSFKNDQNIPPLERYQMGGNGLGGAANVTPLRGYEDQRIGPFENGQPVGGRVMMRHVAETRFAISLNPIPIYVTAFAEAGNVWTTLEETDPFNLKRSAGFGLRLLINPIGLLGFDYGYGFDPVGNFGDKSGWRFHFQFGR
ncbi:MAG: outer membrane protein assembly factor BamA [Bacteroidota bacterium]